uniref:CHHC U11-48K-type domain-containing protein n=1 Tax=Graphocephala atropunctata TaxID=36148 RepID=A0A1B6KZ77_9HEMI
MEGEHRRTAVVCGKLCTAPIGDYFVTCSFDPHHILLRSRMPYHIVKCIKAHPNHNKIQCPFDSTEYIDPEEFPEHIRICGSKRTIFQTTCDTADIIKYSNPCKIHKTPYFHASAPQQDEEWGLSAPPKEEDDEDEGPLVGVGRGVSLRAKKPDAPVKRGMGRAELLDRIFKRYLEQQQSLISSKPIGSSSDTLRDNVSLGQFDNV